MKRIISAAVAAFSLAGAAQAATSAPPLTFVYKGGGCTGVAALKQYEVLIGRKVDGATDFLDYTGDWKKLLGATNWGLGCWQGKVGNVDVSVPMIVAQHGPSPLHDLAAGAFDGYFKQIGESLVSHGFPKAFVRVGWEFNGGWYPWAAKNSPALWKQGYRRVVAAMRSVPGQRFQFVWNPALFEQQVPPDQVYPGDDVVDIVATDAYNVSWNIGYSNASSRWKSVSTDPWGVNVVVNFARAHNKPLAFPEWGTGSRSDGHGGADDPLFIANMANLMKANDVVFQSYWDYPASDYNAQLSGGQYPAAMAAFLAEFGSAQAGQASSIPIERAIGAIMKRGAAPYTPEAAPVLTASNCHAVAVQTAPERWKVIVYATAEHPFATVNWDFSARSALVYDPSVGVSAVKNLGKVDRATFTLVPKQPLIIDLLQ